MTTLSEKAEAIKFKLKYSFIEDNITMFDVLDLFSIQYRGKTEQQISCPFHKDVKASARIYATTDSFYCFSCSSYLTPIKMAKRLLEASLPETLDFLINSMGLQFDEAKLEKVAKEETSKGLIDADKAYRDIATIIETMFKNGESLRRYSRLDRAFLGVPSKYQLLTSEFKELANEILA